MFADLGQRLRILDHISRSIGSDEGPMLQPHASPIAITMSSANTTLFNSLLNHSKAPERDTRFVPLRPIGISTVGYPTGKSLRLESTDFSIHSAERRKTQRADSKDKLCQPGQ
jgi:hypothetical protein